MNVSTGKLPPRIDPRTLQFGKYVRRLHLPNPPQSIRWGKNVTEWGMALNDNLGDCTIAAVKHMIESWTDDASGAEKIIPDSAVLTAYEAVSGYKPGQPNTDNGAVVLDVLNYWRHTGVGGDKLSAYVAMEPGNVQHLREATMLFGGVYMGFQLPISAQSQVGKVWTSPPGGWVGNGAPGSWGGHAVPIIAYTPTRLWCVTWGTLQAMTWAFFIHTCDELYALLSKDWIRKNGTSPSGFDYLALQGDLQLIK